MALTLFDLAFVRVFQLLQLQRCAAAILAVEVISSAMRSCSTSITGPLAGRRIVPSSPG